MKYSPVMLRMDETTRPRRGPRCQRSRQAPPHTISKRKIHTSPVAPATALKRLRSGECIVEGIRENQGRTRSERSFADRAGQCPCSSAGGALQRLTGARMLRFAAKPMLPSDLPPVDCQLHSLGMSEGRSFKSFTSNPGIFSDTPCQKNL